MSDSLTSKEQVTPVDGLIAESRAVLASHRDGTWKDDYAALRLAQMVRALLARIEETTALQRELQRARDTIDTFEMEANPRPAPEPRADLTLTISGAQVAAIADYLDLAGTPEAEETEICLRHYTEDRIDADDGEPMPAGLYVWYVEYPEEGQMLINPAPRDPSARRATQPPCAVPCKGTNCGTTDYRLHSRECFAEHEQTVVNAALLDLAETLCLEANRPCFTLGAELAKIDAAKRIREIVTPPTKTAAQP